MAPRSRHASGAAFWLCIAASAVSGCSLGGSNLRPSSSAPDTFYTRQLDAGGIPIQSSAKVPAEALRRARDIVHTMLDHRRDLRRWLVADRTRVTVMAVDEGTTDLPEQRHWKKPAADDPRLTPCERKHYAARIGALSDRDYWNGRARGMGGPLTSVGAENLLGVPGTRYYGQNILVHEFAHTILRALQRHDAGFYTEVERAYREALAAGRWRGEYAAVTAEEFWAVGTQLWFNSGPLVRVDGRDILSHEDLAGYEPRLSALLRQVYGGRHRIPADIFYLHPARVPPGPPRNTAEIC